MGVKLAKHLMELHLYSFQGQHNAFASPYFLGDDRTRPSVRRRPVGNIVRDFSCSSYASTSSFTAATFYTDSSSLAPNSDFVQSVSPDSQDDDVSSV
ncbi:hypothetical protein Nepgr_002207 [Nepenthes gracilis]|uniref:Uncharacterized protein n=1 Tax=Nepenthes gracilis TaxID=150966 RepID=A0AAD3P8H9_NEPGR|nr:hypothetical protein Nepgr_002207 [Nepenthes gracilis]